MIHLTIQDASPIKLGMKGSHINLSTGGQVVVASHVMCKPTADWAAEPTFVPKEGFICVYTDYRTVTNEDGTKKLIPGIKIGDGNAYLVDLPFITEGIETDIDNILEALTEHIEDNVRHVSEEDRERWDSKNRSYVNEEDEELVLTML